MISVERYSELIARLQEESEARPFFYRFKVMLLVLLGIGYILTALLVALACSVGLIALLVVTKGFVLLKVLFKFIWLPFALSYFILKAMWVKFAPPQGQEVTRSDAPRLFDEIDAMSKSLGSLKIHHILITPDFNASVYSVPRAGILGFPRRYLMLGLPLMSLLTTDELRAVIGHELGHLSRHHMRFSNWIYRVRIIFATFVERMEQETAWASRLFTRFLNWYVPYFNAYSFVLARQNEYEADRSAAELTSPGAAAGTLTKVDVFADYAEHTYWEALARDIARLPSPPGNAYSLLSARIGLLPRDIQAEALESALARHTDLHDTHPCLKDRLEALGCEPDLSTRAGEPSSAAALLGETHASLLTLFDQQWQRDVESGWQARYEEVRAAKERVGEMRSAYERGELDEAGLWTMATSLHDSEGEAAALPAYRALLGMNPNHAAANFIVGRAMIAAGHDDGVSLIEQAMQVSPDLREDGISLLFNHFCYVRRNDERAQHYGARWDQLQQERQQSSRERSTLDGNSELFAHGLPQTALNALRKRLVALRAVKRVWMVQKQVTHSQESPAYFLLVQIKGFHLSAGRTLTKVVDVVCEELESGTVVAFDKSVGRRMVGRIKRVAPAIYP